MNLRNDRLALCNQRCITLVRFRRDGSAESVMVVDQQLETSQHHRSQARLLELGLLADQDLYVVRDRDTNSVNHCVENLSRVCFVELRCKIGIDETLAVGDVDGADCSEDLGRIVSTMSLIVGVYLGARTGVPSINVETRLPPS